MQRNYRQWTQYPYPGEKNPPKGSATPGFWPMFFMSKEQNGTFLDPFHQLIHWQIKSPDAID